MKSGRLNLKAIVVIGLLISLFFNISVPASPNPDRSSKFAAKARREITKLGTGPDARISVKLWDNTKLSGYVKATDEEGFVVVDKTGAATKVPYSQAKKIKGNNLNTGVVIGLAAVAFIIIWIIVFSARNDS